MERIVSVLGSWYELIMTVKHNLSKFVFVIRSTMINVTYYLPSTLLSTSAQYAANTFATCINMFCVGNGLGCQKKKDLPKDIIPLSLTCRREN